MSQATGKVAAIIPAAGSGTRLQSSISKAFIELDGVSLLTRSALSLADFSDVVIVAVPQEHVQTAAANLDVVDSEVHIVVGGSNRQESVAACLKILPEDVAVVLVHDAARPLVPGHVVKAVINKINGGSRAVVPVLPVVDTIKRVTTQGEVIETVNREQLRRVQTPQGFIREVLVHAYGDPTHVATDDAGLVEMSGVKVDTVEGSELAFKITTAQDLAHAQLLIGSTQ